MEQQEIPRETPVILTFQDKQGRKWMAGAVVTSLTYVPSRRRSGKTPIPDETILNKDLDLRLMSITAVEEEEE